MKLTVLGNHGPFAPTGGATSGYLLSSNGTNIVFEMGAGVFSRLLACCRPEELGALVISHLHFDHISDLGVLNYYLESLARKGLFLGKLTVFLPKVECPAYSAVESMGYLSLQPVCEGQSVTVSGVTLTFFEVKHPTPCLGFVADDGCRSLLYSGDTDLFDGLEQRLTGCSAALLDGAFLSGQYRSGGPHMSAVICAELSKKTGVKTFVTHLLPTNSYDDYVDEVSSFDLCTVVSEGEEYDI